MATKKYCSYCNYFEMDTGKFPIRYTCDLHKKRITGNEAETCPDYKLLVIQTVKPKSVRKA